MKFGITMLPRNLDETREVARIAEAAGIEWLGIADSPTVYEESFVHQIEALHATESIAVGPAATHFTVRHPVVLGNLLSTMEEMKPGRVKAVVATGNSAARGLGMKPTTLAAFKQGIAAVRGYWQGADAQFNSTRIPATDRKRPGCPLIVAADGPKATAVAGEVGDALLYSGTMDPEVRRRRLEAAGGRVPAWICPSTSFGESQEEVREELGALLVAMTNRAFRGKLDERGVPTEFHGEIEAVWEAYDYSVHADSSRPRNAGLISDELAGYLIDRLCIWGDQDRWKQRIEELEAEGWTGISFIVDRGAAVEMTDEIGRRLAAMNLLPGDVENENREESV